MPDTVYVKSVPGQMGCTVLGWLVIACLSYWFSSLEYTQIALEVANVSSSLIWVVSVPWVCEALNPININVRVWTHEYSVMLKSSINTAQSGSLCFLRYTLHFRSLHCSKIFPGDLLVTSSFSSKKSGFFVFIMSFSVLLWYY